MARKSLEQLLRETPSTVEMLRNSQIGAYVYPVVPNEFTSWRDEQRAWRESVVLFDQSHHMAELMVEGPDAFAMLQGLAPNGFGSFPVNRAKHFAACGHSGHVIGDVILFRLAERQFLIVGRVPTINWVEFHGRDRGLGRERSTATTARRRGRGRGRWCGGATATRSRGRTRPSSSRS